MSAPERKGVGRLPVTECTATNAALHCYAKRVRRATIQRNAISRKNRFRTRIEPGSLRQEARADGEGHQATSHRCRARSQERVRQTPEGQAGEVQMVPLHLAMMRAL